MIYRILLLPMFLLLALPVISQQVDSSAPLTIGTIRTLHSDILEEDRTLNIFLPADYDSTRSYPVLYLLDGSMNEDFLHVAGLMQFYQLQFAMPEVILVGIANVDRKRDFTFHTDLTDLTDKYPTVGHSEAFIGFLEQELLPFVRDQYSDSDSTFLLGQSLGGLLAAEVLLKKPDLFRYYFITSPSMWWDNESMLKAADDLLEKAEQAPVFVYIAVGAEGRIMKRGAKGLRRALAGWGNPQLELHYAYFPKENHATILHNSLYRALGILWPWEE